MAVAAMMQKLANENRTSKFSRNVLTVSARSELESMES